MDLTSIKALTWDIGGTVFDWYGSVSREVGSLAGERGVEVDSSRFANDWRRGNVRDARWCAKGGPAMDERRRDAPPLAE